MSIMITYSPLHPVRYERHCEACRHYRTDDCWGRLAGRDDCEHFSLPKSFKAEETQMRNELEMPCLVIPVSDDYRRIEETDSDEEYWGQFQVRTY